MKKITKRLSISLITFLSLSVFAVTQPPAAVPSTPAQVTPALPEPAILKNKTVSGNIAQITASPATPTPTPTPTLTQSLSTAPIPTAPKLGLQTSSQASTTSAPLAPTLNTSKPVLNVAQSASPVIPVPPVINAKGYLLIDADSGYVIAQNNQEMRLPPASLTKLMTMYVVSAALKEGRIHPTDNVLISEHAWRTGGSRMFVKVGTQVPAQDLINGIIVASGNDACVAMSEFVAGSENSFIDLMNQMAQQLGMKNTHYADTTGLPDPNNYTTPYDLSILARSIIDHYPEDYKWYGQKWMMYNHIKQPNRNSLLFSDPTVDGLKTGHTDEAGYCLVASAKRNNNMRLIAIVMGAASMKQRAVDAEALLNYGFRFYETHPLYTANTPLSKQRVWFGRDKETNLGLIQNLYVTIPVGQYNQLKAHLSTNPKLEAPLTKGKAYGQIQVTLNNQTIAAQPLVALEENPIGGFFSRLGDHISLLFH